jgi:hypothetical protein
VPAGAKRLDYVELDDSPTLVRTEIPHITVYSGPNVRIGASLRFIEDWNSWEEAVDRFRPLIAE